MAKSCAWCSTKFEVTDSDREFLQKISPTFAGEKFKIPEPTLCPDCRMQRRMTWRNERGLHKRKCDKTGQDIISIYTADVLFPVYQHEAWHGDDWNALDYGREFDFSRTFAENYQDLLNAVPHSSTNVEGNENCDYTNECNWCKDCYLLFEAGNCRDCSYSNYIFRSQDCTDCTLVANENEILYECLECYGCYNVKYSQRSIDCTDSVFLLDCRRCKDCFGCVNLVGKQYYWLNEQLSKEKYEGRLAEFSAGSRTAVESMQQQFAIHAIKFPRRALNVHKIENSICNNVEGASSSDYCFDGIVVRDSKFVWNFHSINDSQDLFAAGDLELAYDSQTLSGGMRTFFSGHCSQSSEVFYSNWMASSSHCFGCFGLKHGKNSILNKIYPLEEYETLVVKIICHMQETGEWGEFFPMQLSPFGYNETTAQQFYPLTEPEATERDLKWTTPEQPQAENVIAGDETPDNIADVTDDILKKTIRCVESGRLFRIQKIELVFYRKHQIPLPKFHPDIRHDHRWQRRQPYKLYERTCAKTGVSILTTYASDTPEVVLSNEAYDQEFQ